MNLSTDRQAPAVRSMQTLSTEQVDPSKEANNHSAKRRKTSLLNRLSIRTKLFANAIIGLLTAGIIATFGLNALYAADMATLDLERDVTDVLASFSEVNDEIWRVRIEAALTFAELPEAERIERKTMLEERFLRVDQALRTYLDMRDTPENTQLVTALSEYETLITTQFMTAVMSGDTERTERLRSSTVTPAAEALLESASLVETAIQNQTSALAASSSSAISTSYWSMIYIAGAGVVLTLVMSLALATQIRRNIATLSTSMAALAEGDLTVPAQVATEDEIGQMAGQLHTAQESLRTTLQEVTHTADAAVQMSQVLSAASAQVAASSAETSAQAAVVATAAEQVSGNVQTVAAGAEQMSASIREIAQNAQEATAVAQTAATTADSTNVTISRLSESSKEIGDVIKTITSIAEQTNLLALNATIEAARAGEAGKGFAVVASEVKDLAAESARAADDVARRVQAIQTDTDSAIGAIGQISEIIGTINNYQLTIASAVEEQTATTNEMSRSAAEAATGSSEIAANINGVAAVVEESTAAVAEMDKTIAELAAQAQTLSDEVHVFTF